MVRADTAVCCLIGHPVGHSLSPLVHNAGYEALGLNFVYLAFDVTEIKLAMDGMRGLGIRGAGITIPHKIAVMKYLDEVDSLAREIGSVNTVINEGSHLRGLNTDYDGAFKALEEITPVEGKRAVLLGAGGTALTLATGLKRKGAYLTILNRTREKAAGLAERVGADAYGGLDDLAAISSADILVNTTSVGMWPETGETLVPRELLHPGLTVFDVVYNPLRTRLTAEAEAAGGKIVHGYKMLLYQAVVQFELFTGHKAPAGRMEEVLVGALEGRR